MKRITLTVAAIAVTAVAASAPAASAATGLVTNGIGWTTNAVPDPAQANDYCSLGAVGTDSSANKVGISAAHCISHVADGATVYRWASTAAGRTPIGTVAHRGDHTNVATDWVVIDLNDDAVLSSNGPGARITSIAPATLPALAIGCKDGLTTGVTCGVITERTASTYKNLALLNAGDSGGPFFVGDTQWAGITHGYVIPVPPAIPGSTYTRATKILADIEAQSNPVGKGFAITNTP